MAKAHLENAKKNKDDEFYTRYEDIEAEMIHYKEYLKDKVVYLNCDSEWSNFYKFFMSVKEEWKIKNIIRTSWDEGISFDSDYAKQLTQQADVVITNPPFSKYKQFTEILKETNKDFIVIGNITAVSYKYFTELILENRLYSGFTGRVHHYWADKENTIEVKAPARWYSNIKIKKEETDIKTSVTQTFKRYANYDALEIPRSSDLNFVDKNYNGILSLPVTFSEKIDYDKWEVVGIFVRNTFNLSEWPEELKLKAYQKGIETKRYESSKMLYLEITKEEAEKCTSYKIEGSDKWYKIPFGRIFIKKRTI